ncbi:hypothetical protein ACFQ4L_06725 [Lapidilactobacillus mulanensis]|uniref:TnpV protein n=1 Tax=Lapidilactobacillus mulanensis TaxID=2485999 RepID=A0ABW4DM58_9LACO|nr:hypothetical protein [Lapidilactobacillus mulanensis]
MDHPVKNGNIGNYYIKFNNFLSRFLIFDRVFSEFAETSERIEVGDCLAAENLPGLKCDWQKNYVSFKYFLENEIPEIPADEYQDFQKCVYGILTEYASAQRKLIDSIDESALTIQHDQVQLAEQKIRDCKKQINQTLQQIVTVSFG